MKYTTHLATGAYFGSMATLAIQPGLITSAVFVTSTLLGSLLPDIDHPQSWLGKRIPFISIPVSAIFGHRGITHSLFGMLLLISICFAIAISLQILTAPLTGILIGYVGHVLGDWVTPSGIPLLWPNKDRYASPTTLEIGSIHETLIFWTFAVSSIIMYSSYLYRIG